MKKIRPIALILALSTLLALTACGGEHAVPIKVDKTELYDYGEIAEAAKVVIDYVDGWENMTLLRVKYDESHTLREMEYRKKHYGEETVIVLLIDIRAELGSLAVGPFSPGRTCSDYKFILTRDDFGHWTIQGSGYA